MNKLRLAVTAFFVFACTATAGAESDNFILRKCESPSIPPMIWKMALADLDNDGDADLVTASIATKDTRVLYNDGTGNFTDSGQSLTSQNHGIGIGDLDGDGDLDLFIACASLTDGEKSYNKHSMIYLNDGSGIFTDSGCDPGDFELGAVNVILFDLDNDSDLDAYVVYSQDADKIYLNDGHAFFTDSGYVIPENCVPGDLDKDGDIDLFVREYGTGHYVLRNDGEGNFTNIWQLDDTGTMRNFSTLADVDNDGDLDAIIPDGDSKTPRPTRVFLNDGTGVFSPGCTLNHQTNLAKISAADLNIDGYADLFFNMLGSPHEIWLNDGKGGFVNSGFQIDSAGISLTNALCDIDGDGDQDLVIGVFRNGISQIWINASQ